MISEMAFNRTLVELKLMTGNSVLTSIDSFNRTLVELKQYSEFISTIKI